MVIENVMSEGRFMELVGETIKGVRVVNGERLIVTTVSGVEIDAGNVRGFEITNAVASTLPITAVSGITGTTAQAALAELGVDFSNINTNKAVPALQKKILSGIATHTSTYAQDGSVIAVTQRFDVFNGYFDTVPVVVASPVIPLNADNLPVADVMGTWSIQSISTTGFSIRALTKRFDRDPGTGYEKLYDCPFHWVASTGILL